MRVVEKIFAIAIIGCISGLTMPQWAAAQQGRDAEDAYRLNLERLNQRYEDFFVHEQMKKRAEVRRRSARDEYKKQKEQARRESEKIRRQFARRKRVAKDTSALERAWEREQASEQKAYNRIRKRYIERRNNLRRIESSARRIPPEKEVGLED